MKKKWIQTQYGGWINLDHIKILFIRSPAVRHGKKIEIEHHLKAYFDVEYYEYQLDDERIIKKFSSKEEAQEYLDKLMDDINN